ncbi:MAG: ABC transporter ATP-binding protein/permease [Rhodospirillaceae bacterium]|nr:ABC transporter ATP-binding protein/permease [Rhodospirillaceae bacterium]MBT4219827.1 ABC transporter ATP-binding protein/permease [Rhodospirillaceae bacterium]MBT5309317.1 ABC transporter ATP-binding protein/permease [Rhodospirillaceae bacterium]MBT7355712.1 ABC transporter ATP-binding protein/permease [Rhodospirillaceae bacterium]
MSALLPYLWPADSPDMRMRVLVSFLLLGLAKAATVAVPVVLKYAVDALTGVGPDATTVIVAVPVGLLLAYGLIRVLSLTFKELQGAVFAKVAERAIRQAGVRTFRHIHALALRFHLDRRTGGLSRAIERGTKGIEYVLRMMLFNIVPTMLEILLVCGLLWGMFDGWFAAITGATIVAYIIWTVAVTEWRIKFRRSMNDSDSEAHTKAIDSLLNYETVKYFGNEEHEANRFDAAMKTYEKAAVMSKTSLSILNTGQGAIIAGGVTIIMIMAGYGVTGGTMTIGDFVLVNTYLLQLYLPLNFLGSSYREIKHSLIDMEQMFTLLGEEAEVEDIADAPDLQVTGGEVEFQNVSFAYNAARPILKDISFKVAPGKTVAIVGASGAGKSTISRLLFRFYDAVDGSVRIDGQDTRDVSQSSWRAAIGIVPQDTVLFNETIYYNIAYGRPNATPAEIEEAARLAAIHDFITGLPDGYQSTVGERGLKLSGGEKQRVAIARTILKRPAIFLFDEATSSLDTHTEKDIQESLRKVSSGRTTLVIAHRLSTVVDADEIIVLEDGSIAERGNHSELLAKDGRYAAMWARQQEAEQAREVLEHVEEGEGEAAEAAAE